MQAILRMLIKKISTMPARKKAAPKDSQILISSNEAQPIRHAPPCRNADIWSKHTHV